MTDEILLSNTEERVRTLTLNRPRSVNALDRTTMRALIRRTAEASLDTAVRAVVLTGAGSKAVGDDGPTVASSNFSKDRKDRRQSRDCHPDSQGSADRE